MNTDFGGFSCHCAGYKILMHDENVLRCLLGNQTAQSEEIINEQHHSRQLDAFYYTLGIIVIFLTITTVVIVKNTKSARQEKERLMFDFHKQKSYIRSQERLTEHRQWCFQLVNMGHVRPSILETLDLASVRKDHAHHKPKNTLFGCCDAGMTPSASMHSMDEFGQPVAMFMLIVQLIAFHSDATAGQSYMLPQNMGAGADCFSKFPHLRRRFSWEQLEFFCQQKRRFDDIIFNSTVQPFSTDQLAYLDNLAINYTQAPRPIVTPVRKEIRRLSDLERRDLESAMRNLKTQRIDGVSKYDLLVMLHHPALAPGSHVGAAFLPWHREYLRRFETALQQINRNVALPYWDSTLDEALIDPLDSVLWTETFFGTPVGQVVNGPYAFWGFRPDNTSELTRLQRNAGVNGSLIDSKLRDFVLSRPSFTDMTSCTDLTVERTSRLLHEWVGGSMENLYYSPQDPIFFYHHVYIDYVWGLYRLNQSEVERRTDYPSNIKACTKYHYGQAEMKPFGPMKNIDGLGPWYGDYFLYEYSPECQTSSLECDSKYLFCHPQERRCASKVKIGGNCMTLPQDSCFQGICNGGICVPMGDGSGGSELDGNRVNVKRQKEEDSGSEVRRPAPRSTRRRPQVSPLTNEAFSVIMLTNRAASIVNDTKPVNASILDSSGEIEFIDNKIKEPNKDPFSGPLVATDENRQDSAEDVLPGEGRPKVTRKPRPKETRQKTTDERPGFRLMEIRPNITDVQGSPEEN